MFLHSFSQRHVSALPRAIFRLITIQLAMLIVWFALQSKK